MPSDVKIPVNEEQSLSFRSRHKSFSFGLSCGNALRSTRKKEELLRLEKKDNCAEFMIRNSGHHRWITQRNNVTTVVSLISTTVLLIKTMESFSKHVDHFKRARKNFRFVRREVVPELENAFVQFKRRWNSRVPVFLRIPKKKRRRRFGEPKGSKNRIVLDFDGKESQVDCA